MVSGLFPYAGHHHDLAGVRLHYIDEGTGPPVVCLHGNPTWSFFYRDVIAALRPTHRVIAPDHIGCGRSDKPPAARYPYTLARRVDDLTNLLDRLIPTGPVSLVVHDWGGMIGFAWAVRHAQRIYRLVVMNTAAFPLPAGKPLPLSLRLGRNRLTGPLLNRGVNAFCRGAARYCVTRRPLADEVRSMYLQPYNSWRNRVAVDQFVRTIPLGPGDDGYDIVMETESGLPQLANRPILLAWGLRDFVFDGDFLAEWRRRFPNAEVAAVADAGHYLLEDAGDELIPRLVRFLQP